MEIQMLIVVLNSVLVMSLEILFQEHVYQIALNSLKTFLGIKIFIYVF